MMEAMFFCRLKDYIYIFDENLFSNYIQNFHCKLKPYKAVNGDKRIFIVYVENEAKIKISMYKINLDQAYNKLTFIIEITTKPINNYRTPTNVVNNIFSYELINNSNYTNKLLVII